MSNGADMSAYDNVAAVIRNHVNPPDLALAPQSTTADVRGREPRGFEIVGEMAEAVAVYPAARA